METKASMALPTTIATKAANDEYYTHVYRIRVAASSTFLWPDHSPACTGTISKDLISAIDMFGFGISVFPPSDNIEDINEKVLVRNRACNDVPSGFRGSATG
jgi:hypothetical protein